MKIMIDTLSLVVLLLVISALLGFFENNLVYLVIVLAIAAYVQKWEVTFSSDSKQISLSIGPAEKKGGA